MSSKLVGTAIPAGDENVRVATLSPEHVKALQKLRTVYDRFQEACPGKTFSANKLQKGPWKDWALYEYFRAAVRAGAPWANWLMVWASLQALFPNETLQVADRRPQLPQSQALADLVAFMRRWVHEYPNKTFRPSVILTGPFQDHRLYRFFSSHFKQPAGKEWATWDEVIAAIRSAHPDLVFNYKFKPNRTPEAGLDQLRVVVENFVNTRPGETFNVCSLPDNLHSYFLREVFLGRYWKSWDEIFMSLRQRYPGLEFEYYYKHYTPTSALQDLRDFVQEFTRTHPRESFSPACLQRKQYHLEGLYDYFIKRVFPVAGQPWQSWDDVIAALRATYPELAFHFHRKKQLPRRLRASVLKYTPARAIQELRDIIAKIHATDAGRIITPGVLDRGPAKNTPLGSYFRKEMQAGQEWASWADIVGRVRQLDPALQFVFELHKKTVKANHARYKSNDVLARVKDLVEEHQGESPGKPFHPAFISTRDPNLYSHLRRIFRKKFPWGGWPEVFADLQQEYPALDLKYTYTATYTRDSAIDRLTRIINAFAAGNPGVPFTPSFVVSAPGGSSGLGTYFQRCFKAGFPWQNWGEVIAEVRAKRPGIEFEFAAKESAMPPHLLARLQELVAEFETRDIGGIFTLTTLRKSEHGSPKLYGQLRRSIKSGHWPSWDDVAKAFSDQYPALAGKFVAREEMSPRKAPGRERSRVPRMRLPRLKGPPMTPAIAIDRLAEIVRKFAQDNPGRQYYPSYLQIGDQIDGALLNYFYREFQAKEGAWAGWEAVHADLARAHAEVAPIFAYLKYHDPSTLLEKLREFLLVYAKTNPGKPFSPWKLDESPEYRYLYSAINTQIANGTWADWPAVFTALAALGPGIPCTLEYREGWTRSKTIEAIATAHDQYLARHPGKSFSPGQLCLGSPEGRNCYAHVRRQFLEGSNDWKNWGDVFAAVRQHFPGRTFSFSAMHLVRRTPGQALEELHKVIEQFGKEHPGEAFTPKDFHASDDLHGSLYGFFLRTFREGGAWKNWLEVIRALEAKYTDLAVPFAMKGKVIERLSDLPAPLSAPYTWEGALKALAEIIQDHVAKHPLSPFTPVLVERAGMRGGLNAYLRQARKERGLSWAEVMDAVRAMYPDLVFVFHYQLERFTPDASLDRLHDVLRLFANHDPRGIFSPTMLGRGPYRHQQLLVYFLKVMRAGTPFHDWPDIINQVRVRHPGLAVPVRYKGKIIELQKTGGMKAKPFLPGAGTTGEKPPVPEEEVGAMTDVTDPLLATLLPLLQELYRETPEVPRHPFTKTGPSRIRTAGARDAFGIWESFNTKLGAINSAAAFRDIMGREFTFDGSPHVFGQVYGEIYNRYGFAVGPRLTHCAESLVEIVARLREGAPFVQLGREAPVVKTVADLGCGTGVFARRLLAEVPSVERVTCVDMNPAMCALAEANVPAGQITTLTASILDLPVDWFHAFTVVVSNYTLHLLGPGEVATFLQTLQEARPPLAVIGIPQGRDRKALDLHAALCKHFGTYAHVGHYAASKFELFFVAPSEGPARAWVEMDERGMGSPDPLPDRAYQGKAITITYRSLDGRDRQSAWVPADAPEVRLVRVRDHPSGYPHVEVLGARLKVVATRDFPGFPFSPPKVFHALAGAMRVAGGFVVDMLNWAIVPPLVDAYAEHHDITWAGDLEPEYWSSGEFARLVEWWEDDRREPSPLNPHVKFLRKLDESYQHWQVIESK